MGLLHIRNSLLPQRGSDPTALEPRPPPARLLSAVPLTLLSAILLVELQAWTEPLQARTNEMPAQEQPPANDQDVVIYLSGDDSSSLRVPDSNRPLNTYPICPANGLSIPDHKTLGRRPASSRTSAL
ncbi:neutrophil defensin 1-like [Macaca fascicularis]|uniref:neutrophil defensin 1-like n=1 Tax=Macaca fascicularis TaxID=9541 RepID=UPI003D1546D2